ncbi:MAG: CRTAC1 family protein [Gemmataceae bacterium]
MTGLVNRSVHETPVPMQTVPADSRTQVLDMRPIVIGGFVLVSIAIVYAMVSDRRHSPESADSSTPAGAVRFEDRAGVAGLDFRHFDPATPAHQIIETIGSGLGWIDYDADGWPDLLCIQSGPVPPGLDEAKCGRLYRNNRDGTFQDVTNAVGWKQFGFGQGCAVGDYDNDGFDDVLVTRFGGISLYHNVPDSNAPGGRRFEDVTASSGLENPHWGTSCAWADLDGDGRLDLYVCNYVGHDPASPLLCKDGNKGLPIACNPTAFPLTHHRLFRNRGDGRFDDVSRSSGISSTSPAAGLAVGIVDLDDDNRPDIYVANDLGHAYCFRNLGGMKFQDVALASGVALGPDGLRMSGMGVEAADFDGSGRPSLFVTNFQRIPNVFYLNRGALRFEESSLQSGLGGPSVDRLGFGTCMLDANLDGVPDLAVANGHVQRFAREAFGVPYAQEPQFFLGLGSGKFQDESRACGDDFLRPRVGRGLARCDYDNDGRPDLALSAIGEPVALFQNRCGNGNGWIGLELVGDGRASNRNAIGASVRVVWSGGACRHFVIGGGSYLSANDRRLTLGLGTARGIETAEIRWPSGVRQTFKNLEGGRYWKLVEGNPDPARSP